MIGGPDKPEVAKRLGATQLDRTLARRRNRHRASLTHLRVAESKFSARTRKSSLALSRITRFGGRIALALGKQPETRLSKMTVAEAAAFIGRSERTIRRRIRDGQLAPVREGRRMLVPEGQLWQLTARHLSGAAILDTTRASGTRRSSSRTSLRTTGSLRGIVGAWVATVDGEVIVAADSAREVVVWLKEHDRVADSMFRLPLSEQATEGAAPA